MRIGDSIQAGLNAYDPTPYLSANRAATQSIGGSIAGGVGAIGDAIDRRAEYKSDVKMGKTLAKAMETLYPELEQTLAPYLAELDNDENPLSHQAALGKGVGTVISQYIGERDNLFERDQRERALKIDESRHKYDTDALDMAIRDRDEAKLEADQMNALIAPDVLSKISAQTAAMEQAGQPVGISSAALQQAMETMNPRQKMGVVKAALEWMPEKFKGEINYNTPVTIDGQAGTAATRTNADGTMSIVPFGDGGPAFLPEPSISATFDSNGVITPETEQQVMVNASKYLPNVDVTTLPLGMRNNNPTNIVYPSQAYAEKVGAIGASRNKDAGSTAPGGGSYNQLVFDNPVTGMKAGVDLAKRKYEGGMTTTNSLIAGSKGWTPGNTQAAANIARTMGVKPGDDLKLNDPVRMKQFMQALIEQEHGKSGRLYGDEIYDQAIGASFAPGRPVITPGAVKSGSSQTPIQQELDKAQLAKIQGETAAAQGEAAVKANQASAKAARVISIIDKYSYKDAKGERVANGRLGDAVGFGAGVGEYYNKAFDGRTQADQQELTRNLIETSLLEAAKDLKPVSEDEMRMLMDRRPKITDGPEAWARFMTEAEAIIKDGLAVTPAAGSPAPAAGSTAPAATPADAAAKAAADRAAETQRLKDLLK
jgi:hypothetical protein